MKPAFPFGPYLRLVRLPLVFTALGDPVAAALGAGEPWSARLAGLALASGLFYLGGMALNDVVDLPRDTLAGRDQPLVRGEISWGAALALALALLCAGAALALGLGARRALFPLAAILLYDLWAKRDLAAGLLAMAACRYGNAVLGLPPGAGWPWGEVLPWVLGLHTLGLTAFSQLEDLSPGPRARALAALALLALAAAGVLLLLGCARPLWALPVLIGAALWVRGDAQTALRAWRPELFGRVVGKLVAALILVDGAWLLGQDRALAGVAVLALIVPARWGARAMRRGKDL